MAETTSANYPAALANSTSLLGDHSNQLSLTLGATCLIGATVITTTGTISTGAGNVNAPGYCLIDSELIHFTGVSGATLTGCTRPSNAAGGGAAAEHANGTTVYFVPTANWANQIKDEIIATQTELGTDPAGAFTDVNTSLNTWLLGVTNSITAGSTQSQAGAAALTKNINRVTVVGTNGDGVKLPTAVAGLQILIINDDSAQTIKVWPATSDAIDGGSANAVDANQIVAGSSRRYIAVDATNWYTATPTTSIANDSITLAMMAGGTDGNIISYDASGDPVAIATGNDGQVLTSAGAGAPPAFEAAGGGGITAASQWRLTTNFDGDQAPIASNLEEVDAPAGFGILGSSMTESSGIFTFPSTGFWLVKFDALYNYTGSSTYTDSQIYITTDNSTYNVATYARSGINASGPQFGNPSSEFVFDVTSTSNCKVRFHVKTEDDSATCKGDTGYNYTNMTFIRLGDT